MSIPVSIIIPTLNEADRLPACLRSVQWADDIIVIDGGSTDGTQAIARGFGARVLELTGTTIGAQKNHGIRHARHHWVLSIDADERVTPELAASVERAIAAPTAGAYRLHLRNVYLGAPYERGAWGRDRHVRLYPSTSRWTEQRVHEQLVFAGDVAELDGRLEHESYRDLAHQLTKAHRYGEWGAKDLWERGHRTGWKELLGRPLWRFVKTYFVQGMWREGRRGLVFCAVYAWGGFVKYALLWDHERKMRAMQPAAVPAVSRDTVDLFDDDESFGIAGGA